MLLTKAKEFNLTGYKSLIAPYREQAINLLKERKKNKQNNDILWDTNQFGDLSGTLNNYVNVLQLNNEYKLNLSYNELNCKIYLSIPTLQNNALKRLFVLGIGRTILSMRNICLLVQEIAPIHLLKKTCTGHQVLYLEPPKLPIRIALRW